MNWAIYAYKMRYWYSRNFKKAGSLLDIIENTSNAVLYIQAETKIKVEFNNNYRS